MASQEGGRKMENQVQSSAGEDTGSGERGPEARFTFSHAVARAWEPDLIR